jgi:hypothetical protein
VDNSEREVESCSCPFASLAGKIKRFIVKHVPLFRKRAERAAVSGLLGKLGTAAEASKQSELRQSPVPKSVESSEP